MDELKVKVVMGYVRFLSREQSHCKGIPIIMMIIVCLIVASFGLGCLSIVENGFGAQAKILLAVQ